MTLVMLPGYIAWLCCLVMLPGYVAWLCCLVMLPSYVAWLRCLVMLPGYVAWLAINNPEAVPDGRYTSNSTPKLPTPSRLNQLHQQKGKLVYCLLTLHLVLTAAFPSFYCHFRTQLLRDIQLARVLVLGSHQHRGMIIVLTVVKSR